MTHARNVLVLVLVVAAAQPGEGAAPNKATFPATVESEGDLRTEAMRKKRARPGNPLGWGLSRHSSLEETSHVAPPATYPVASRTQRPLPRIARAGRVRPGPVFHRHDPGQGVQSDRRRSVPFPGPWLVLP